MHEHSLGQLEQSIPFWPELSTYFTKIWGVYLGKSGCVLNLRERSQIGVLH